MNQTSGKRTPPGPLTHARHRLELTVLKLDIVLRERKMRNRIFLVIGALILFLGFRGNDYPWRSLGSSMLTIGLLGFFGLLAFVGARESSWEPNANPKFYPFGVSKSDFVFNRVCDLFEECSPNEFKCVIYLLEHQYLPETEGLKLIEAKISENLEHWEAHVAERASK